MHNEIKFIDLFAGMGGTRVGFEQAAKEMGMASKCVFSSEIKEHAIEAYNNHFSGDTVSGDITSIAPTDIPDFDYLLAGFPCQPFSSAGNRHGFMDERGGLFFTIWDILKTKKPAGFLLENVDGLVSHDGGKTISTIMEKLIEIGYFVDFKVIDSSHFGVPQKRKRVYIVGDLSQKPIFKDVPKKTKHAKEFIDYSSSVELDNFTTILSKKFSKKYLEGKSIKDKRGGDNNIHSWDLELKGKVTKKQRNLLSEILKKRRSKQWAENKGIDWMDGMPLTLKEIMTFIDYEALGSDLKYLASCGYLKLEHPKELKIINGKKIRVYKVESEKGYNIVSGKLSFPIAKIIDPNDFVPTIVATEYGKLAVATDDGVRRITITEGLKFSGFPSDYKLDTVSYRFAFDLLGNTVMPPVIKYVSQCLLEAKYVESRRAISEVA